MDGEKRECKVQMNECTFDEDPKDYEYVFTSSDDLFRKVVEKQYAEKIWEVLREFPRQLVSQNSESLLVASSNTVGGTNQDAPISIPAAKEPLQKTETVKPKVGATKTTTIDMHEDFKCSPEDLFAALTNADRIKIWTQGPCTFDLKNGADFTLFNGAVSGNVESFETNKSLKMKWRLNMWPKDVVSTVNFVIQNRDDFVRLVLEQVSLHCKIF